jgi:hypothetical protein
LTSSEDLIPLARKFGENIAKIVGAIFSLFSDTDDMAENLLDAFFDVNVALQKFTTKFLAAIEDLKAGGTSVQNQEKKRTYSTGLQTLLRNWRCSLTKLCLD